MIYSRGIIQTCLTVMFFCRLGFDVVTSPLITHKGSLHFHHILMFLFILNSLKKGLSYFLGHYQNALTRKLCCMLCHTKAV